MAKYDYNIVVIGAGAGGLVSSYIAAALKAKVALIEKHEMGGDCLNTGCVPSKALIAAAKTAHMMRHASQYGVADAEPIIDFEKMMEHVHDTIKTIEPHDSVERYEGLGVECFKGAAMIKDAHHVEVNGTVLSTQNIILATGAEPAVPPIKGLDDVRYVTSDTLWQLKEQPKRLLVVGGGPIGCELAMAFNRLGSEVTQIDMAPRVLMREDEDIAAIVQGRMQVEGVVQHTGIKLSHFTHENGESVAECELPTGESLALPFDVVLLATGRRARTKGYGLEELGVKLDKRGFIDNNPFLQTNIPNIFVCGDISGSFQFTHYAAHQAYYACVNALFGNVKRSKVDNSVMPWVTFTVPEIARVGLNEMDAKEQNIPYEITSYEMSELDRAITERHTDGVVKILTKPGKDTILGVTIVAQHAGEMLAEFTLAMKHGLGLNKILGTIHPYPTWAEAAKNASGVWKKAHVPEWVMPLLTRYHKWRRG